MGHTRILSSGERGARVGERDEISAKPAGSQRRKAK